MYIYLIEDDTNHANDFYVWCNYKDLHERNIFSEHYGNRFTSVLYSRKKIVSVHGQRVLKACELDNKLETIKRQ